MLWKVTRHRLGAGWQSLGPELVWFDVEGVALVEQPETVEQARLFPAAFLVEELPVGMPIPAPLPHLPLQGNLLIPANMPAPTPGPVPTVYPVYALEPGVSPALHRQMYGTDQPVPVGTLPAVPPVMRAPPPEGVAPEHMAVLEGLPVHPELAHGLVREPTVPQNAGVPVDMRVTATGDHADNTDEAQTEPSSDVPDAARVIPRPLAGELSPLAPDPTGAWPARYDDPMAPAVVPGGKRYAENELELLNVPALRDLAKSLGIQSVNNLLKQDLIEAILAQQEAD